MNYTVCPDQLARIEALSNACAPSGFEEETLNVARPEFERLGTVSEDKLRNLICRRPDSSGTRPTFMLDAHSDEVGFMVHSIHDNGTIRFVTLGSWALNTLPASKVRVRNAEGQWIPGIIAAKPVHFMSAEEKQSSALELKNLVIDVGTTSREEAQRDFGIRMGEPIVSEVHFSYDAAHDIMMGKAFDCRIGCAALIETMNRLKDESLDVDLTGTLSSQEELGERGVRAAVQTVRPDIAICFEGCPADDTFTETYAIQTALRKGPMLRFMDRSVICSPRFMRYALDLAEQHSLPVQTSVREGGGNNGAIINNELGSVPVIVIGIPVRYIHSHYGIASYYDYEAAVQLAVQIIRSMNADVLSRF